MNFDYQNNLIAKEKQPRTNLMQYEVTKFVFARRLLVPVLCVTLVIRIVTTFVSFDMVDFIHQSGDFAFLRKMHTQL